MRKLASREYLPLEGQIGSLQMRMMLEARAFLDPMLNLGLIEPDAAQCFLIDEVTVAGSRRGNSGGSTGISVGGVSFPPTGVPCVSAGCCCR